MTFKEFIETKKNKPWVAKKDDVLKLWNSIRPDAPINPTPVSKFHSGNRFDQDGIRITGTSTFINSILGRLKPLLFYSKHPQLDLDVKYRQVVRKEVSDKASFACYINIVQKKE